MQSVNSARGITGIIILCIY